MIENLIIKYQNLRKETSDELTITIYTGFISELKQLQDKILHDLADAIKRV